MSETNAVVEKSLRSVFVGNIPYEATEEKLRDIFSQAGPVLSFKLMYDRETGNPKGYGFCEYKDQETALSSMRNLNGYEIGGRPLRVDNACTEKSRMEMQSLMMGPVVESPYGPETDPDKAPEAISNAVASLPPEQMFELMRQMKLCVRNNPSEARTLLMNSPQLAYALLQAQVVMRIIDAKSALQILHPESEAVDPLLPASSQAKDIPNSSAPITNGNSTNGPAVSKPMPSGPPMIAPSIHNRFAVPPHQMGGPPILQNNMPPAPVPPPNMFQTPVQPPRPVVPPMEFGGGDFDLREQAIHRPPLPNDQDMRRPPARNAPPMETFKTEYDPRFKRDFDQRDNRFQPSNHEREPFNQDPRENMRDPRGMDRDYRGGASNVEMRDPRARHPPPDQDFRAGPPSGAIASAGMGMPGPNVPRVQQAPPPLPAQPPPTGAGQDQEKANLIMQVLKLSDEQIRILPPEQQASIMKLKQQIQRSSQ